MKLPRLTFTRVCIFAALLATIAGVLLRFVNLSRPLTYDELYTAASTWPHTPFSILWTQILSADINPPLYNMGIYLWVKLFSFPTELALRLPSLLSSLATVAAAWFFTPKPLVKYGRILLTGLLCVGYFPLYYAQDARSYSLALLAALLLTFWAIGLASALQQKSALPRARYTAFLVLGLLACYLHYFAGIYFFCLCLILSGYALFFKRHRLCYLIGPCSVLAAFSPWLILAWHRSAHASSWIDFEAAAALAQTFKLFFGSQLGAACAAAILVVGLCALRKVQPELFKNPGLCVPAMVLPLFIGLIGLVSLHVNLWLPRYFIVLIPAVYFLVSLAGQTLIRRDAYLILLLPLLLWLCLPATARLACNQAKGLNSTESATAYLTPPFGEDVLFYAQRLQAYPPAAVPTMMNYYPQRLGLAHKLSPLTTAHLKKQISRHGLASVLVPVCDEFALADLADLTRTSLPLTQQETTFYAPARHTLYWAEVKQFGDACALTVLSN